LLRDFFRKSRTREDGEDLAQQTFISYLESAGRFRGESSVSTFLVGIARNTLRAHRRRTQRLLRSDLAAIESGPPSSRRTVELREAALQRGMEQLPPELFAVLDLHYWRGIAQSRIADQLGVPVGTVASRIRRAKETLRAFLEAQENG
jgi:RNA polymerase sigma-70 factor (ECF subfamily)